MDSEANRFEHVLYEMLMYYYSYVFEPGDRLEENMRIECRAIHLRTLVCFFRWEPHRNRNYWHVSDFVTDTGRFPLIEKGLYDEVWDRASCATGHLLLDCRDSHEYKVETMGWYERAFLPVTECVTVFLDEMDERASDDYREKWGDDGIRGLARRVKEMMCEAEDSRLGGVTGTTGTYS